MNLADYRYTLEINNFLIEYLKVKKKVNYATHTHTHHTYIHI